jgi:hypothetical protein
MDSSHVSVVTSFKGKAKEDIRTTDRCVSSHYTEKYLKVWCHRKTCSISQDLTCTMLLLEKPAFGVASNGTMFVPCFVEIAASVVEG